MGGRVAGKAEIITNSAQLGLELGLSLAKKLAGGTFPRNLLGKIGPRPPPLKMGLKNAYASSHCFFSFY